MTASNARTAQFLGYLAFVKFASHGIVGGYLLVNHHARPIEFHCTAPFRATRTEEILYGSTLQDYVYCDQIGSSLTRHSQKAVCLIVTDEPLAMGLRRAIDTPMLLLPAGELDGTDQLHQFHHEGLSVATRAHYPEDPSRAAECLRQLAPNWDFTEPLQRIRDAVDEAQRAAA